LPDWARAHALVPGEFGSALVRLDLARAELAIERSWGPQRSGLDAIAFAAAAAAPTEGPGRELGRELYRLGIALVHEHAVAFAFEEKDGRGEPHTGTAQADASPNFHHHLRRLEEWYAPADFAVTPDDRKRALEAGYVFRAPALSTFASRHVR